ncbi:molecular chaperone TorD [Thalassotalea sp. HSM 43]|uniref:molecular chaperone TorD n=1 Tax=Thalassotalea sp. HSM 43 TaxID=2552945 RepID=UPI00107FF716|nr:molecular chaperone TorD [Thalassotalea sp. HSM 43]QBY03818.1 molecular chaperone TorD [Thalassotalea sp. HSM 43]
MQDKQLIEIRATIFWWFSTLLSKELSKEQFNAYINQQGATLLDQLALEPLLAKSVSAIKQSLAKLNIHKHPYIECKVEFSQLFLMDNKNGAPPYASIYLSNEELMFQQAHDEMVALLKKQGLAVIEDFNEPADHIAIQLDYLGNLVLSSLNAPDPKRASAEQLEFIQHRVLNWLPLLLDKMSRCDNSGFYQGICQLLYKYLLLDVSLLKEDINAL